MGTKQLRFSYQLPLQKRKDSSTKEEHNNIKYTHTYTHTIQLATKDYNFFKKR